MKELSPQIDIRDMEERVLQFWEDGEIFQKSLEKRKHADEFTFNDGPPFANGLPHYGHLLANTVKDTVPRYWSMRGYYVERRFGWDCHGFPVETEIQKKHDLKGRPDILAMGIPKFNEACRESVLYYAGEWEKTITRLGRWVDWNHQYRTMDKSFMESVWWVVKQLDERGLLYRGHKVVAYSPHLSAVLSNFEANQNYKDVQDPAITAKFKLCNDNAYVLAWTTTPWTLISNLALAVGPEINYVKVQPEGEDCAYWVAEDRLEAVFPSKGKKAVSVKTLGTASGKVLAGEEYEPLFNYFPSRENAYRILADDYVSTSEGTGIVHMAPAYGEDDFRICKDHGIELVDPLDENGCFQETIPELASQFVKDADKNIIKMLKDQNKLFKQDTIVHSYPHCERTEGPLIYRSIPAWYVRVEGMRDKLVENNKKIRWVPEHLRDGRMGNWLENARDWAISRNRFWGTPIPIWQCEKNEEHREIIGSVAELEAKVDRPIHDLHKHLIDDLAWGCQHCDGTMKRIPEVLDCWFESGSMPYAQLHYPFANKDRLEKGFPADFIAEGLDQTRGWFYTLSILSEALFGKPAFKNVVVNGLVLAKDGKKMSKRLGNYTPPVELLNALGADSVRLYMLNSPILRAEPLKFSDEGVKETTRTVLLPYWNAISFLTTYAKADGWKPNADLVRGVPPKVSHELDRWIISRLQSVISGVHEQMEEYKLYQVVPEILGFIDELTNWYIRLSRRRFWGSADQENTAIDTEAFSTLYYVCVQFTKVFAPFAPFISEHVYRSLTDSMTEAEDSVHLCDIPMAIESCIDKDLENHMALVRTVTNLGRSLRAKHQLKTRQVLPSMMVITKREDDRNIIEQSSQIMKDELNIKRVEFSADEAQFVNLSVKPNLRLLGPKLGKNLGALRNEFMALNESPEKVAALLEGLTKNGKVSLAGVELTENDLLIDRSAKDDQLIATAVGVTVLLDTKLTPELIAEGQAREVINRIQNFRKDSGLKVTDRIKLTLQTDAELASAIDSEKAYIARETLAEGIHVVADLTAGQNRKFQGQFDIDGRALVVQMDVCT